MTNTALWNGKLEDCLFLLRFSHVSKSLLNFLLTSLQDTYIEKIGGGAEAQVLLMEHKEKKLKCAVKRISNPTPREI
jgi:hypothetical protein